MNILKEREIGSDTSPIYRCPKCKKIMEFECNELRKYSFLRVLCLMDGTTGSAWFSCNKCDKEYLIKDYALEGKAE